MPKRRLSDSCRYKGLDGRRAALPKISRHRAIALIYLGIIKVKHTFVLGFARAMYSENTQNSRGRNSYFGSVRKLKILDKREARTKGLGAFRALFY